MARKRDVIPRPDVWRQSTLAGAEVCMRRTLADLRAPEDMARGWVGSSGDLGTVFHAVAAEMLRSMWKYGNEIMPEEEAMVILREVYYGGDIILPTEDRWTLRGLVLGFCKRKFRPDIATIERRLTLDILCPDGEIRTFKGQPDVTFYAASDEIEIVDFKTGMGKPKKPKEAQPEGQDIFGKQYLSDRGHYQLDGYGLLVLKGKLDDGTMILPGAQRVTLREIPLRWPKEPDRIATLHVGELEHIESEIGGHMMMLDRAISEGPKSKLWRPRNGSHCMKQCPVSRSCPIKREQRGEGAIATPAQADAEAGVLALSMAKADQARLRLKGWQEAGNPPGRVNDREEARWGPEREAWQSKGNGRKFGIWPSNGNGAT